MTRRAVGLASTELAIRGSLIDESYAYFRQWGDLLAAEPHDAVVTRPKTAVGRSARWDMKVDNEMRRRFDPKGRDRALAVLAAGHCPLDIWRPLLFWHLARHDCLLYDFLVHWLHPQFSQGVLLLRAPELWPYLRALPGRGLVSEAWSEKTISRVASQLLHVAEDFGLLRGKLVREFTSYHLPEESFLYLLHAMIERQPNAREVVHSPDWRMFLMDAADVERELFRLHQFRRVHYEVAGSLAQLTLPCDSAADYAREMVA